MGEIILGDDEIESLINGGTIQKSLPNGEMISIRQSYMKDLAAPLINRDKKIFSNAEIKNIKIASSMMKNAFKSSY